VRHARVLSKTFIARGLIRPPVVARLRECAAAPDSTCRYVVDLVDGDLFHWRTAIVCTASPGLPSPYDGGVFELDVRLPQDYPFKPPRIDMVTPIYHPSVSRGRFSLDVLSHMWNPALTVRRVSTLTTHVACHVVNDYHSRCLVTPGNGGDSGDARCR
jgi:hypothetical protein